MTTGVGDVLGITSGSGSFDPNTFKPVGTAESLPDHVRLSTKKLGVDSVNIYMRLKGQSVFKLTVAKRVSCPFDDDTPPAVAGQAEQREYQFRASLATMKSAYLVTSSKPPSRRKTANLQ